MRRAWEFAEAVAAQRLVAIVRAADAGTAEQQAATLVDAGVAATEVSLTTPDALAVIARLADSSPDRWIGAGTVLDVDAASAAVRAGARFLVTPTTSPPVIAAAARYGVPIVAGAATPTEAVEALECGATLVKLFPASMYGPAAVADLLSALPQLPLVPTGGVDMADAVQYVAAGAIAVGMGSGLAVAAGSGDLAPFLERLAAT